MTLYQDILTQVFNFILDDARVELSERITNLYSCILVNHIWCTTGYQILWKAPFSLLHKLPCTRERYSSLVSTYLKCLPPEDKIQFMELRIPMNFISVYSPYFNYSRVLKNFSYIEYQHSIFHWTQKNLSSDLEDDETFISNHDFVSNILTKHFMQIIKLKKIEFLEFDHQQHHHLNLNLNSLNSSNCSFMKFSPKSSIYDLTKLPGANEFFGNITSLSTYKILDSIILKGLAKICHSIKDIYINCDETNYEGWSTLLNSQSNLLHLKIRTKNTNIPLIKNALMNKVNTLISLSLIPICLSMNIFINCPNLHELEIMENPNFLPNNELYQFLSIRFPNLEFLTIKLLHSSILFPYFSTFIQNHSKTLKYLSVTCFQNHLLIKTDYLLTYSSMLIEFCSNLLEYIGPISIKHIPSLFNQCSNLYRISLLSNDHYNISICSELEEIGNLLPKNLMKLKIPSEYKFTANSLERFLQCCEDKLVKELELDISRYSLDLQIILEKYRMKGVLNKIWVNIYILYIYIYIID
ncbi:hypothetical protein Glove_352g59 [Diversispora epigaea]|uniref:F-box domain-containing protein n=1 Tax=Diversispora epigaea TaxID=1348612 RepID=A0A397HH25_9GLOM|nr:hypothetical protein Glove_352g59 [Diversispora epigaea]